MPALAVDTGYFDAALRIVNIALHGRINQTAQTSLANDILCVAAGLRSAALIEQLYLNPNDIERIQSMFHHTTRFHHLDLLSIGDNDHIFIIHRALLLQDIHDYLSGSEQGLRRVFVNVDYLLSQPEILPGKRYEPLDKYLQEHVLPDLQMRIQCWDQAELCYLPLPAPDQHRGDSTMIGVDETTTATTATTGTETAVATDDDTGLSMVTLSGWLLGYPVNYVLPTIARMKARKRAARTLKRRERVLTRQRKAAAKLLRHQQQQQQQAMDSDDQVLPTTAIGTGIGGVVDDSADCSSCGDDGNMSDDEGDGDKYTQGHDQANVEEEDDDENEEDEDSSHNSLANRVLVLTQINLSANEDVHGLQDHCLLSFNYPSALLDRTVPAMMKGVEMSTTSAQLPTAPASPLWLSVHSNNNSNSATTEAASQELNPFETSLLPNNSSGNQGATSTSYSTAMPGALPPTPPYILATTVPSSSTTTAPVVPSIILSPSPSYLAPPAVHQHNSQHRQRRGRSSSSRHPFDLTPDSSDDLSSSSSSPSSRSPYIQEHSHFHAQSHHQHRSNSRPRRRRSSPNPTTSESEINPVHAYRFYRSEEPFYQHHRQQHRMHCREKEKREEVEDHDLLPPSHPDICAAGRSLLEIMHLRFQRQGVWKTWQVGQQTVTLPVVAL
ncbi:MAG: hypothetical protein J3R72DRAFT_478895 [Linnemannia gamsii]|nr:MAG: hypothetical protein J3R72DRAFT_478895 [Linnemannia gamsii]